ncbi:uncharacterized protein G2W53_004452 [Senna tora]|uniref:Uncharacterized protein n=1 Tax=Senna tora TaxID=362788 RepID=A0A834XBW4_9FABA|nr:uncharacterized protein G2W53_004452 [Senna tora]
MDELRAQLSPKEALLRHLDIGRPIDAFLNFPSFLACYLVVFVYRVDDLGKPHGGCH